MDNGVVIFTGNSNPALAQKICEHLNLPLGGAKVTTFSDGEIQIEIHENVRAKDVFVIQSTCSPVNDNLVELLLMIDAFKRSSARRITAVIPYYGYARQDKKVAPRVPISAKLVADMLTMAGAHRVITMDLHAGQIQGFFDIPLDHLFAVNVFVDYVEKLKLKDLVVVSPDVGGIKTARAYAKRLGAGLAIVDKRRISPEKAEAMNILGEVEGRDAVLVDDLIATGGSLIEAATFLKKAGVKKLFAAVVHGVLSGDAVKNIERSAIEQLIITDTIPLSDERKAAKIKVLSVASLFAEAIKRIHREESISCLFEP